MSETTTALTISESKQMAQLFAASGMFSDAREMAQAFVKIQAGQELGVQPFAAMTGIHIIKGKPSLGAGLIAGRIKGSGKYDYQVIKRDTEECRIEFLQNHGGEWRTLGVSSFTMEDAKTAKLLGKPDSNWAKYPTNMLFARAISNGARFYTPDVFNGPVYTPEELGAVVEVIDGEAVVVDNRPLEECLAPEVVKDIDSVGALPADNGNGHEPHWLDVDGARGKFWAWTKDTMGLTEAGVYEALGVDSVHKIATKAEAARRIKLFVEQQQLAVELDEQAAQEAAA